MRILIAPLNWGLGHATRSLTLAYALKSLGHEIVLASSGGALNVLREAFPGHNSWEIPDYQIGYAQNRKAFAWVLFKQLPKVIQAVKAEHHWLMQKASVLGLDAIVSDGRYGLWHPTLPCYLVTHQLRLQPPLNFPLREKMTDLLEIGNLGWLRRFTEIWIPDVAQAPGLSGELGHPRRLPSQARYLGPLNRFAWEKSDSSSPATNRPQTELDWLAVVSGPEPQRTLFEAALKAQLSVLPGTRLLIQGLPTDKSGLDPKSFRIHSGEFQILPHLPGSVLRPLMQSAKAIVTRSGYTTVMELACLGIKPVLMVATPGQSEQEHIAAQMSGPGWVLNQSQEELNLAQAAPHLASLAGLGVALRGQVIPGASQAGLQEWFKAHPLFGKAVTHY